MHRDREQDIAELAGLLADAIALVAEHEYCRRIEFLISKRLGTLSCQSVYPETFFFQIADRIVLIADSDERDAECHAGGNFHDCASHWSLIVLGNEHALRAESRRRAVDGADILRILHLAQDDESGVLIHVERLDEVGIVDDELVLADAADIALMHGIGRNPARN